MSQNQCTNKNIVQAEEQLINKSAYKLLSIITITGKNSKIICNLH